MKKLIGILAVLLFVVACAPQQAPETEPEPAPAQPEPVAPEAEPAVTVVAPEPTPTAGPSPEKEEEPAPTQLSKELAALLKKADQKVKSYRYLLGEPPNNLLLDTYYIKGSKIKIDLYEYDPYDLAEYFDTVYLDDETSTAVGYCKSRQRCQSKELDNTVRTFELDYHKYRKTTPYEWLKEIPDTAKIVGPQVHEARSTTLIEYDTDGAVVEMWIDDTYGLPVKIVQTDASGEKKTWNFNDFLANTLTDADISPPFE